MNLKYYLRGLGLGILVTVLILELSGNRNKTMTDDEIRKRAMELGMIENTVLTEPIEEPDEDVPEASLTEEPAQEAAGEAEKVDEQKEAETPEEVKKPDSTVEEVQENETEAVQSEEETEGTGTETAENDTEAEEPSQTVQDGDQMTEETDQRVVLTIVHGDSSYSVAKKLYDMGVVSSVEEYDRYLCQNGYDRGIRPGTYEIEAGTSLEQIAKMINGK